MEKLIHLTDITNLPLSANQKRLWIIYQQNKIDPSYNIQLAYHLDGEINVDVFGKSIEILFERQHSLFSVFRQKEGVPYISIIHRQVSVELIDFSDLSLEGCRKEILSFAGEQSRLPFDIAIGPLYRLYLLKESKKSYYFCFTVHHLIFDGFSRRLFVQELSKIYSTLIIGVNYQNDPLKFHSYDFAALEKDASSPDNELELIEFWKENLKACPPELKFPYDYPRNNNPSGFGCREPFQIPNNLTIKLRALSQASDTSVFKTLLSILGILFNKYTGENDICIGIPVSNRKSPHSFKTFGFFVDTLPIRLFINEDDNFRNQITYSTEVFKRAVQNSLPFDKIVGILKPERIPGLNPFFQICFSWINNFTIPMDLGGISGKRITVPEGISSFDISFYMWENGDCIEGEIEYNIDVIKQDTIIRLRDSFLILVNNLLENPEISIGSLTMISDQDRAMIDAINETGTDYPKDKTIVQLFEEQVDLYPDKTAVVFKDSSLTYNQLNQKANQLARVLRNSGIISNDPVGILADKSVDAIVGIFGILKAGGAYVPVDPEYPLQRKNFILQDSGCKILITQDKYITDPLAVSVKLSLDSAASYHKEKSNVEGVSIPTDLAYIIYTSGTTGMPKGTLIPQQGVVRLVRNTNYVDFKPSDRVLQTAAIVFDASTEEIFGALLNGATLYLVDKETILDPTELGIVLSNNDITIADLSSALFAHIAESHSDIFYKLKTLLLGGEVLSAPHLNKVRKANPLLTIVNGYGPTENSCNSTAYIIERDFDYNVPIGKPISNSTAYIFDKNLNYQPVGIVGELYVGGDGLSKGYLNREDLNKKSFIEHPYYPGKKLYKTGDLARWLPDGNIEFQGRIDNQIKIRGFRVECEGIEAVLSEIEGISEAIVKPVKIDSNDSRLVAFLDVSPGYDIDFNELKNHLKEKLPSYMVPSAFKKVNGFPLTVNGKTDRKALTIDESDIIEVERVVDYSEFTSTQKKILKIWQDSIKTKSIGLNDNFFDAGGTSLLAIWVVDKIEKEFNISLSLRMFFDSPKIQSLAEIVEIKINSLKTSGQRHPDLNLKNDEKIIKGEL